MRTLSKFMINEGITFNNDAFIFDFSKDSANDIIKLSNPTLQSINVNGLIDVIHFVYTPEQYALKSDIFNKFITYLKNGNFKEDANKRRFVTTAISKLHEYVNLLSVGSILYPQSRSNINIEIVKDIRKMSATRIDSFELIKNMPEHIEFDFDSFNKEELSMLNVDGSKKYNNKDKQNVIASIKQIIARTKTLQYFSIASAAKSKYKPYFTNFLKFANDADKDAFLALSTKDILIVDDVTTTGTTILEICKIIRSMGIDSRIIVFTVVGNKNLF